MLCVKSAYVRLDHYIVLWQRGEQDTKETETSNLVETGRALCLARFAPAVEVQTAYADQESLFFRNLASLIKIRKTSMRAKCLLLFLHYISGNKNCSFEGV